MIQHTTNGIKSDRRHFSVKSFSTLTNDELYDLLKLRIDVFVVEQNCPYEELDEWDRHPGTLHTLLHENNNLIGYCRVLPADTRFKEPSIGRLVVNKTYRGQKNEADQSIGKILFNHAVETCKEAFPQQSIAISAQAALEKYYQASDFNRASKNYLEDNIPHLKMIRDKT